MLNDAQLERLTLRELRDLNAQIEDAIRAAIRAKRMPKQEGPKPDAPRTIDLERERDAWLAAKR